jgi:hypothetical protein
MNLAETKLKPLISVTPTLYETLYAPIHHNLEIWFEKINHTLPAEAKKTLLEKSWQRAIDALKIRRGYLLPFGSDAETCYREQDHWTYAVFTAMLGSVDNSHR